MQDDNQSVGEENAVPDQNQNKVDSQQKQGAVPPEMPDLKKLPGSPPPKAEKEHQPEFDDNHIHQVEPVISDSDFDSEKGTGTQNEGTSGF